MSRTSTALKRLGVAGLAAVTMGAVLPAVFAAPAQAASASTVTITPDTQSGVVGACQSFTLTVADAAGNAPTDTTTVEVRLTDPNAATNTTTGSSGTVNSVSFCNLNAGAGSTSVTPTGNATNNQNIDQQEFVLAPGQRTLTFGVNDTEAETVAILAFIDGTGNTRGDNIFAGDTEPSDTAVAIFTNAPPASPPATNSPSPGNTPPGCAVAQLARTRVITTTISAGAKGIVEVDASPNSIVELFAYTRPNTTFRKVREAEVGADGRARFDNLVPPANTRLQARESRGIGCAFGAFGPSVVMNVRTTISLAATRVGPRTYVFSGDTLPARRGGLIVSLYRVTNDGRQILTSQVRASETTGEYRIVRRFTGTGRFGFVVRTGQDIQNAPGASNVRSLLVF